MPVSQTDFDAIHSTETPVSLDNLCSQLSNFPVKTKARSVLPDVIEELSEGVSRQLLSPVKGSPPPQLNSHIPLKDIQTSNSMLELVLTGGDDNSICAFTLTTFVPLNGKGSSLPSVVMSDICRSYGHCAQITGESSMLFIAGYFIFLGSVFLAKNTEQNTFFYKKNIYIYIYIYKIISFCSVAKLIIF